MNNIDDDNDCAEIEIEKLQNYFDSLENDKIISHELRNYLFERLDIILERHRIEICEAAEEKND